MVVVRESVKGGRGEGGECMNRKSREAVLLVFSSSS
jgi:hypothetical protein